MLYHRSSHGAHGFWIRACLILFLLVTPLSLSCSKSVVDEDISAAAKTYTPPRSPRTPIDSKVNSYDIQLLEGGNVKLQNLVGNGKVVLVNVWATWCGPCRREIPDLVALHNKFKGEAVEVVGLTVDDPDKESVVRAFTKQFSMNYK